MNSFQRKLSSRVFFVFGCAIAALLFLFFSATAGYGGHIMDTAGEWAVYLDERIPPVVFVALMFVLPALGFPLSVFLLVAGMKFGVAGALMLTALTLPVHLFTIYLFSRSLLRSWLVSFLAKRGHTLPALKGNKATLAALIGFGLPGPPFALKNYTLALAGVPLPQYLVVGWLSQMVLSIPFIIIGESAMKFNLALILGGVCLYAAIWLAGKWIKRRLSRAE